MTSLYLTSSVVDILGLRGKGQTDDAADVVGVGIRAGSSTYVVAVVVAVAVLLVGIDVVGAVDIEDKVVVVFVVVAAAVVAAAVVVADDIGTVLHKDDVWPQNNLEMPICYFPERN